LDKNFTLEKFKQCIYSGKEKRIKNVLMDPSIIAGIGNIYSDEILWRAGVKPERKAREIKNEEIKLMYKAMKEALAKGIDFGGDSMSDYRNIYGLRGEFQLHHDAYRRTGEKCRRKNCTGVIIRKVVGGRSAHFCSVHQK
jgi:formamidopyrimidine-DNA glycosylase